MGTTVVKNENHVVIHGWMIKRLGLRGNELIVFAIIYGFSQENNQYFTGSRQYLADWTVSTTRGIQKNLNDLLEKGFIEKHSNNINGRKSVYYSVTDKIYEEQEQKQEEQRPEGTLFTPQGTLFTPQGTLFTPQGTLFPYERTLFTPKNSENEENLKAKSDESYKDNISLNATVGISKEMLSYKEKEIDTTNVVSKEKETKKDDFFSVFWTSYPRKVAKAAAAKIWERLSPDEELSNQIIAAVENNKNYNSQWKKDNGQFIPHPATWLNQKRWEDQITIPMFTNTEERFEVEL